MATRYNAAIPLYRSIKKGCKGMKVPLWKKGEYCLDMAPRTARLLLAKGWIVAVEEPAEKEAD